MEWTHLWISKETSSHLYGLRQLKRSRVAPKELILFCSICILSLLEYACQFFHVHYQPTWTTIWNIYKGAFFGLLTPTLSYAEALRVSGLPTLFKRREEISWNSSSRSLQIRNTNCIHFCQKWTYILTALGTKDYINDQDVGLNVARTILF